MNNLVKDYEEKQHTEMNLMNWLSTFIGLLILS